MAEIVCSTQVSPGSGRRQATRLEVGLVPHDAVAKQGLPTIKIGRVIHGERPDVFRNGRVTQVRQGLQQAMTAQRMERIRRRPPENVDPRPRRTIMEIGDGIGCREVDKLDAIIRRLGIKRLFIGGKQRLGKGRGHQHGFCCPGRRTRQQQHQQQAQAAASPQPMAETTTTASFPRATGDREKIRTREGRLTPALLPGDQRHGAQHSPAPFPARKKHRGSPAQAAAVG